MADVSSLDVRLYVKRRPLLRLDVGPFAVAYGALHGAAWAAPSPPVAALVAIPVVLTLHLFVFLSTRWSVACRCLVAYRRVDGADAATHALATPADAKFRELVALARDAARGGAPGTFVNLAVACSAAFSRRSRRVAKALSCSATKAS
mmetsp:Transcript_27500/g.93615  ORF Transcript_27500/g.93615 Transcript_27500/m.93615 type:complete len:148 (+) Transcript_27500:95-538(+)